MKYIKKVNGVLVPATSGGSSPFRGVFLSFSALVAAIPVGEVGNYAQVDPGAGTEVVTYFWDLTEGWITGGDINVDGGFPFSAYLITQNINGGTP